MCYAIPGKVTEIKDRVITVDYFGEKRKAKNDFYELAPGDYVYAQGGLVIQKISEEEAIPILETWREYFFKLQETDLRLAHNPKTLYQTANSIRQKHLGNACCVHGIIEFSNYCRNNCLYCGIRKDNAKLKRYRMGVDEILAVAENAVNKLGFKAIVLQSGEDMWYDGDKLADITAKIRERCPALLVWSIGERDTGTYKRMYAAGARGVLLRFETADSQQYARLKPGQSIEGRVELIESLRDMGYLIFTGFLVGLPGQEEKDILGNIEMTNSLGAEMFSFGPFIPHPETPLADASPPSVELALTTIARSRILYPEAKILVTTAMETIAGENGMKQGLLSGGNSLMINLTPQEYRALYEIYPGRGIASAAPRNDRVGRGIASAAPRNDITGKINSVIELLKSIGRAPTDIGI
ncbi:MAG: radical SAM protein [Elusimicrobiota bacterium]